MDNEQIQALEKALLSPRSSVELVFNNKHFSVSYDTRKFNADPHQYLTDQLVMHYALHERISREADSVSSKHQEITSGVGPMVHSLNDLVGKARDRAGNYDLSTEEILKRVGTAARIMGLKPLITMTINAIAKSPEVSERMKTEKACYDQMSAIFGIGGRFFGDLYTEHPELPTETASLVGQCQEKAVDLSSICEGAASKLGQILATYQSCMIILAHLDGGA